MTNHQITAEASKRALDGFFPGNLGIDLQSITDEEVRGRMAIDKRHLHPGGFVHGGAWVAFADTVAAWGTMRHVEEGGNFTTVELKANVFATARDGDVLEAVGTPVHVGRRTQVWQVHITRAGKPAALFVCTQMVL